MSVKTIDQLKADIDLYIKANGNKEITGTIDNGIRNDIVDNLFRLSNRIYTQATEPLVDDLSISDLWVKNDTNQIFTYNGATWDLIPISGSGGVWGTITGVLEDQLDLQDALDLKAIDTNVVHRTGDETISGNKEFRVITTNKTTLTVTTTLTQPIYFKTNGSYLLLDLTSATGDTTLELNEGIETGSYFIEVLQGATSRDIILPVTTTTLNGSGNIVLGIASATQYISLVYNGSNYVVIGTGQAN